MLRQWGWRIFQVAIVVGVGVMAKDMDSEASPGAVMIFGIIVAALLTGILAALFRFIRRATGRETVEDRIWRETPAPRSNLAPAHDLAEGVRFADRRVRREAPRKAAHAGRSGDAQRARI